MGFYDLSKPERVARVDQISEAILSDLTTGQIYHILDYFSDEDTYIRKTTYLAIGKLYQKDANIRSRILSTLNTLLGSEQEKVRQTAINSAGEIGMVDFEIVRKFFDIGLFDEHHSVRNAVIGSLKKMGGKNPKPTLKWAKEYLNHKDKEVRREICHGIELRGRTHPQDVLPLLKHLEHDETARVRNTLIHVLGQIAYKKGCLETVVEALKTWENRELVQKALDEIVDVHDRYKGFSFKTQQEAIDYIDRNYKKRE